MIDMKKLLFINFLLLLPICLWGASGFNSCEVVESISTNNGNVYFGFIQTQIIGQEVEFQTYATIFQKPITSEILADKKFVPKDELNEKWKWIEEDSRFDVNYLVENGKTGLMLYSFPLNGSDVENVVVLNTGKDFIRYIDISNRKERIKLSDIKSVENNLEQQERTGLLDVIQFNDSRDDIKGYIIKQNLGKNISIKKIVTGVVTEINLKDIKAVKKVSRYNDTSFIESSRWIEVIETKSGKKYEGIITKKGYDQNGFMTVVTSGNSSDLEIVRMRDVVSIKRKINTDFMEPYNGEMSDSVVIINNRPVCEAVISGKSAGYFTIKDISDKIVNVAEKNNSETNTKVIVRRSKGEDIDDIIAFPIGENIVEEKFYYKDLLNESIQSKRQVRDNIVIDVFDLSAGFYLLYVKNSDVVYIIEI